MKMYHEDGSGELWFEISKFIGNNKKQWILLGYLLKIIREEIYKMYFEYINQHGRCKSHKYLKENEKLIKNIDHLRCWLEADMYTFNLFNGREGLDVFYGTLEESENLIKKYVEV